MGVLFMQEMTIIYCESVDFICIRFVFKCTWMVVINPSFFKPQDIKLLGKLMCVCQ